MSLLRAVTRACTVGALRQRTFAGAAVYDSDNTPFAQAVSGQAKAPYITVYTDTDDRMPSQPDVSMGREINNGDARMLSLVLEMAIAGAVVDTNGGTRLVFAQTDQALEFALDCMEAQVLNALWQGPTNAYGQILRQIVQRIRRMPSRRGGQSQAGIRFAARRTTFVCSTIDDIVLGATLSNVHPINQFINLSQVDTVVMMTQMGQTIQAMLNEQTALPSWQVVQGIMGMTKDQVYALNPDGIPAGANPFVEEPRSPPATPYDITDTNPFVPALDDILMSGGPNPGGTDIK